MMRRASKMARHLVVKEEAERGTLLENLIERLSIKEE